MPSVKKTIQVAQPLKACWNILSDLKHMPEWDQQIQSVTLLGSDGVGQRIDFEESLSDNHTRYIAAFMTRYNPPHEYAFRYLPGIITWEVRLQLQSHGSRTQIQRTRTARGIPGLLMWYWLHEKVEAHERGVMLQIKKMLDASTPG